MPFQHWVPRFWNHAINPLDGKGSYSATSNYEVGMAVDGWAVTFGTARGLGGSLINGQRTNYRISV